jgi:cytochrome P450
MTIFQARAYSMTVPKQPLSALLNISVPRGHPSRLSQLRCFVSQESPATRIEESLEGCPITGKKIKANYPMLTQVPSLPFIGTLFHPYSGTPKFNIFDSYNYHKECYKRFGDFYTLGLPGLGTGLHGTVHITTDPNEMAKVIRSEGAYPSGVLENFWYLHKVLKDTGSVLVDGDDYGLFGSGERWKRQRTFLQEGMLDPKAAKRFIPGIMEAARLASKGAPAKSSKVNEFLNYCSFDMFNTFMFGELTRCSDPSTANEENIQFCKSNLRMADLAGIINFSPYEMIMGSLLGINTRMYNEYKEAWNVVNAIATGKVNRFIERYQCGTLNDLEKASYLAGAIERQAKEDSAVSKEEMIALCVVSLTASIDTTSAVTAWNLVHLAIHQEAQEKVYAEIQTNRAKGVPEDKISERAFYPYLHACIREAHRITPPLPLPFLKRNNKTDVVVNGITFKKGTTFSLNNMTDAKLAIADAEQFKPERWLKEAVEQRKGSSEEIYDHPIFRDPFGQGARRCPGSRVANNEVLCMISQLVSDYKIVATETSLSEIKHELRLLVQPLIPKLEFIPRQLPP